MKVEGKVAGRNSGHPSMTKYLDKKAEIGDRVEVHYEGTVTYIDHGGSERYSVVPDGLHKSLSFSALPDQVKTLAPKPKAGDIVTEGMELPVGTTLEPWSRTPRVAIKVKEGYAAWRVTGSSEYHDLLEFSGNGTWQIKEIPE